MWRQHHEGDWVGTRMGGPVPFRRQRRKVVVDVVKGDKHKDVH